MPSLSPDKIGLMTRNSNPMGQIHKLQIVSLGSN